jgi:tRNA G18 (ribose-2'-O)-methylase SpoU
LVGEEIDGQWNAAALADVAELFGGSYIAYGGTEAATTEPLSTTMQSASDPLSATLTATSTNNVGRRAPHSALGHFDYLVAAENATGAQTVYSFRPPPVGTVAIVLGNEARGLRRSTLKLADAVVEIPLTSRNINCLNVAAAAAVMLYYLSQDQRLAARQTTTTAMSRRRPDVLLIGVPDHMELGSTIRSVCAFGWEHVFLEDPHNAWYECDRRIKSEGRGTARRGRNPIKVIPHRADRLADYRRMVVYTKSPCGRPAWHVPVAAGDTLAVLPDESQTSAPWSPPQDWEGELVYASLPEAAPARYHYRQMSAIALAEIARQVGKSTGGGVYLKGRKDRYRREVLGDKDVSALDLEDLMIF